MTPPHDDRQGGHVVATTAERGGTLPDFIIVGAQRSGTTSLARYLAAHPEIHVVREKEVHFFDRYDAKGIDWYKSRFSGASRRQLAGEATPEYMYLPRVPPMMAKTVPHARLIAILRNPVDRAYSEYLFARGQGYEQLSFEEAIAAEPQRLVTGMGHDRTRYAYLDRGHYLRQLMRITQYHARERLLVLLFEDLAADPVAIFRRTCTFLSVNDEFAPRILGRRSGRSRTFRSHRLRSLSRRLPYPLGGIVARLNTLPVREPPMDPALRAELLSCFKPENDALAAWLERDLDVWNR